VASLGSGECFLRAAEIAGYGFANLLNRTVDVAHERHLGVPAPPGHEGPLATSEAASSA
jgi:hypothetical protein